MVSIDDLEVLHELFNYLIIGSLKFRMVEMRRVESRQTAISP